MTSERFQTALPEEVESEIADIFLRGMRSGAISAVDSLSSAHPNYSEQIWDRALKYSRGNLATLGDYRIQRKLGEGAHSAVYLAMGRGGASDLVALKVAKSSTDFDRRTLRREAEILSRLQHRAIVALRSYATEPPGPPLFAMEFIDGQAITEYCTSHRLGIRERIRILIKVCLAIEHAHQKGVVHLDIKPEHILVSTIDGLPRPKIIDFGISECQADPLIRRMPLDAAGTLGYMAPEQLRPHDLLAPGERPDTRADIYSLGIVTRELLFAMPPAAPIPSSTGEQESPSRAPGFVPLCHGRIARDTQKILRRALQEQPKNRYSSVSEMKTNLEEILAGEMLTGHESSLLDRSMCRLSRHWRSSLAISLAIGWTIATGISWVGSERPRSISRALMSADRLFDQYDSIGIIRGESLRDLEGWSKQAEHVLQLAQGESRTPRLSALGDIKSLPFILDRRGFPMWGIDRSIREITRTSLESRFEWEQAWNKVESSLLDDPRFQGVRVTPQSDLMPLVRDPISGLWSFWHMYTGERPNIEADLVSESDRMGIVLVLVPGGSFGMGLSYEAPIIKPEERDSVPTEILALEADDDELPSHRVEVQPFFTSKFELTQFQWTTMAGSNPSAYRHDRLPVHYLSHDLASSVCSRFGLELPSEAQWEYACRAGSTTAWSCGDSLASLFTPPSANIKDRTWGEAYPSRGTFRFEFRDGFADLAPVGSLAANAFGLHDMSGNVWEMCADDYHEGAYKLSHDDQPFRLRRGPLSDGDGAWRSVRGGAFDWAASDARASSRWRIPRHGALSNLGVRPIRRLR